MADLSPAVVALTHTGQAMAQRIAQAIGGEAHGRAGRVAEADVVFQETTEHLATLFLAGRPVIGVFAAGILIRALAPYLSDKRIEPPVIAVAEDGSAVVPLLGGHHGANTLAARLAEALQTKAAITTAGDVSLGLALDAPPPGWRLANPEEAKPAMAALLAGARLVVEGPLFDLPPAAQALTDRTAAAETVTLVATTEPEPGSPTRAVYHPQTHTLGLGSARGCDPAEMAALVEQALAQANLAPGCLAGVVSLDLKADERAMVETACALGLPFRVFDAARLEAERPRLATPSAVVFAEVGCHGVAEGAALAAAGPDAILAVPKIRSANATVAIARAPEPITNLPGRPRGRLAIIGIGPGQAAWRAPEASRLIAEADELVGYGLYLDLLGPAAAKKAQTTFRLGEEEARCRYALERAGEGHTIALISSGDAGIYAMAALVFELLDREGPDGVSTAARRAEVTVAPGISALQAAAARVGAPLGHDFCAISLSDLMTPREDILRRVRAVAEGDFVIAFYNPVSQRRRTLLAESRQILLGQRPPDCPVLLASNLGRAEERLVHRTLETLEVDEVDMLTLVLVGSSATRRLETGDGTRLYTPRGYERPRAGVEPVTIGEGVE